MHADHAFLDRGVLAKCSKVFATAPLSGPVTTLVALGLIVAVVFIAGSWIKLVAPVGRGPPRAVAPVFSGQELLTRFCIARR
ncbi:hypothetical protein [Mycobacterium intracellulare]|uniref:hypothetical protein n=1 Tax=Mycobacterium intracellulare TaxID=1767 RepID=UPI001F518737|nr:hypothetical protein [Mycobacterium intracellulare]